MLQPKKTKFKKSQRGRLKGSATHNISLSKGNLGIQVLESFWMTAKQIETINRTLSYYFKRSGKIWLNVFPDKPITARSAESRMGSGKGAVSHWVAVVHRNTIILEVSDVDLILAEKALKIACYKLPVKTKIVKKNLDN